ncbi:MAG: MFS transporter [Flavobacterium sp.]|nr:MFS transporter [Candidatus Neoflavobacterium equi]
MIPLQKGSKKLLNAWAFYDWSNSVYSLVISSAIFPLFFGQLFKHRPNLYIDFMGMNFKNTALISFVTALAFFVVAVISPFLSGIADFLGNKKRFMQFFCYLGSISCIGLYWFDLDQLFFSLACYFFGLIGFWGSLVFYNSYLPDIAHKEQQDGLSAKGYSLGYIGSVILMIFNLILVMKPDWFGITGTAEEAALLAMRISFLTVGIWWMGFSQYTFYYLPVYEKKGKLTTGILFSGFKELKNVWNLLGQQPQLKRYLTAFFVYSMAVQTVMLVATFFGEQVILWKDDNEKQIGLIVSILMIQLVAVGGAILTSKLSSKYGNIKVLMGINFIFVIICTVAYFVSLPIHFYITAAFVGLVMGGIQSLSRSTYSKFLPETKDTTSFFSFYDVTEKVGIVIGMFLYGYIDQLTGSMRNAIVFLIVFFLFGIYLLKKMDKH